jgi:hypothetical protein
VRSPYHAPARSLVEPDKGESGRAGEGGSTNGEVKNVADGTSFGSTPYRLNSGR